MRRRKGEGEEEGKKARGGREGRSEGGRKVRGGKKGRWGREGKRDGKEGYKSEINSNDKGHAVIIREVQ